MKTRAKVTVQLEITCGGSWGESCTMAQVKEQAKSSAMNKIDQMIKQQVGRDIERIDEPKVTIILIEE